MAKPQLTAHRLAAGVWEGLLTVSGEELPRITVSHLGQLIEGVTLAAQASGEWMLRIPVPTAAISDGVQTIVITDATDGTLLGSFTLIAGDPLEEDLRAEVALLRAELELLKKALRRHAAPVQL